MRPTSCSRAGRKASVFRTRDAGEVFLLFAFCFGFVVVVVVFVRGHRFFAPFLPYAIFGGKFTEDASHFTDVRRYGAATRADIIHSKVAGLGGVFTHFAAR